MKHFEDNNLHITFTFERYDFKSLSMFAVLLDWFRNNSIKLFKCRLHLTLDAKAIFKGVRESTISLTQWVYFDKDEKTSIAAWKWLVDMLFDSSFNPRKIFIKHIGKFKNVKLWDFFSITLKQNRSIQVYFDWFKWYFKNFKSKWWCFISS